MEQISLPITLPGLSGNAASEQLDKLLSELKRDRDLTGALDLSQTGLQRPNPDTMDFGATLLVVLGTSAVTYLCMAVYRWAERTGTSVVIDGVEIKNLRSEDVAKVAQSLAERERAPLEKGGGMKHQS